jgi:hypothetical protein
VSRTVFTVIISNTSSVPFGRPSNRRDRCKMTDTNVRTDIVYDRTENIVYDQKLIASTELKLVRPKIQASDINIEMSYKKKIVYTKNKFGTTDTEVTQQRLCDQIYFLYT